ncbi:hypothetical protein DICPUDRAFT_155362 [Dictyostelium purpureum]|uniref:DUF885 domain-containing protein n=1 Tax=Dictyostelium purpureum TaxID=5786 RepID=F0ZTS9_DICPU|nr:uncharacterized protein DICPUDRAFT_155362 [Dictyostelium purpureum]EGC32660.1 hypothetical protein DICPUDRAFT_155362 [Dictyostelium purpureum]|eukprot:XP_003290829.1 hypothetical protein DICPUDRAFT_155362 [Dictyostelium purpureum]
MATSIGYLLTRYGIITSIRKIILLVGIIGGKFLLLPIIEFLVNKFVPGYGPGEESYFNIEPNAELAFILVLFYILNRFLFGIPFTFKLYSIRMLLVMMEGQFLLLTSTRAFDSFGLKCQHTRSDDLSPAQQQKNLKKIEVELKTLDEMESKYGTPKSKDYVGFLTAKAYFQSLKQGYQLLLYPSPKYFIYPMVYSVNQFAGAQSALIDVLTKQQVDTKGDAQDFVERIEYSDQFIDGLLLDLEVRKEKGIIPSSHILDLCINNIESKILQRSETSPEDYFLYKKLNQDLIALNTKGKITQSNSDKILKDLNLSIEKYLIPSYEKLNQYLKSLKQFSKPGDGIWRCPNGEELYTFLLKFHTNTDLTATEIHEKGLKEVKRIKDEIIQLFKDKHPDIERNFGEVIRLIPNKPELQFSEGDKGREEIIKYYKDIIVECTNAVDDSFERFPKAACEVERVPLFKEAESAPAYYNPPAMDKSKGGIFSVNLRDTTAHNKSMAKDLCIHEAIPGHHLQLALAQEFSNIDAFRRVIVFTSFAEGWGLYTETLGDDLGLYKNKYERLGYLSAELWRALRLVVDTALHSSKYKWTREKAIQYFKDNTNLVDSDIIAEVDRYTVMPGQACAYKIGQMKILELREKAKKKLGSKFDLKKFHSAILNNGSLPLDILEISFDLWLDSQN